MNKKTTPKAVKIDGCQQGCLRIPKAGGKASSEGTSMYMHAPPQGRISSYNSPLEGQCSVHWSRSYTMLSWGSGDLSLGKFY